MKYSLTSYLKITASLAFAIAIGAFSYTSHVQAMALGNNADPSPMAARSVQVAAGHMVYDYPSAHDSVNTIVFRENIKESPQLYETMLTQYGNWRIQIEDCVATPNTLVVPAATSVLIDGFSDTDQLLMIGEEVVELSDYEANIAYFMNAQEETTIPIHCEKDGNVSYNIATLMIQQ